MNKQMMALMVTTILLATSTAGMAEERVRIDMGAEEQSDVYERACASCHMAYAPSMLPERSWKKLMSDLENHFGDDAEVSEEVQQQVTAYLARNAAEHDDKRYAKSMLGLLRDNDTPLRVSGTTYFKLMHDLVKPHMVGLNSKVKTFARCEVCHHQALQGKFNRMDARIPGYFKRGNRFVPDRLY